MLGSQVTRCSFEGSRIVRNMTGEGRGEKRERGKKRKKRGKLGRARRLSWHEPEMDSRYQGVCRLSPA